VEELLETQLETHPQVLYHVPNFITKLNLLNLFMQDIELFTKTVVFVNTRFTAENIYKNLQNRLKSAVAIFNPWSVELNGVTDIEDFKQLDSARVLIIANENNEEPDLKNIAFLLHFELPADKETYINRITTADVDEETMAITFITDLELNMVKKIEQATGQKIAIGELPEELVIENDRKHNPAEDKQAAKNKVTMPEPGAAFHEKKAKNAKTTNYSSGTKAKMDNKRKHS